MVTSEADPTSLDLTTTNPSERRLNPILSARLTEIRGTELPFHEKARRYEDFLRAQGCSDVVRVDCDVCVDALLPPGRKS